MTAGELLEVVKAAGGVLELNGEKLRCRLPEDAAHLAGELRAHKPELVEMLRQEGGRIAAFPHCPKCASYALYRENNLGDYECQSCGLQNIEESAARRVM
ncbi:MAG: hypothetical protein ABSE53_17180 [Terracidiphilus sp.]|jgi:Zn ribbon nucleic-acid-binding protein